MYLLSYLINLIGFGRFQWFTSKWQSKQFIFIFHKVLIFIFVFSSLQKHKLNVMKNTHDKVINQENSGKTIQHISKKVKQGANTTV
jgi:predicted RND superfamily exporter protein